MKKILVLAFGDLKNIGRDYMLILVIAAPVLIWAGLRWALPPAAEYLSRVYPLNLMEHYLFIVSYLSLLTPMLLGILAGFIILDERDDHLLEYYAITPLQKSGYLGYRLVMPIIISFILTLVLLAFSQVRDINLFRMIPIALMSSLEAPLMALFLGIFAGNKVEGLALSKLMGLFLLAPIAGYVLNSNWRLLAGIFPTFWVTESFLSIFGPAGPFWFNISTGLFFHIVLLKMFLKHFSRKAF